MTLNTCLVNPLFSVFEISERFRGLKLQMTCADTRSESHKCDSLFCLWDYGVNTSRVVNPCYVFPMITKSISHRLLQSDSTVDTLFT